MIFFSISVALLAAINVHCQTPPGFKPSTKLRLGVTFQHGVSVHPGHELYVNETQSAPRLNLNSLLTVRHLQTPIYHLSWKYMVFMIDMDVDRSGMKYPLLHWYQPDLVLNDQTHELSVASDSTLPKAMYAGPAPPPGPAHRYVEVLFVQPEEYKLPEEFEKYLGNTIAARLGFNIEQLVKEAGLGEPIAGNWFLTATY
ncbi:phosphatidylethanolamine-binding protein [Xylogone sp. PMI_703]|nr:phosphatidylethanolamine-binding protein [Xylogone sp. PMI_703]